MKRIRKGIRVAGILAAVLFLVLGGLSGYAYLTSPEERENRTHGPGTNDRRCKEQSEREGYSNYYLVLPGRVHPSECLVTQKDGTIINLWKERKD